MEVELKGSVFLLDVAPLGRISFESPRKDNSGTLSAVNVKMAAGEILLRDFAQRMIYSNPNKVEHSPVFSCAIGDQEHPFLALIGLLEVIFITPDATIATRRRMNRHIDDDWGFFDQTLIPRPNGFVHVYEFGIVSFGPDGTPFWQHDITPHDYLLSHDASQLCFRSDEYSDYSSGDWLVRLDTGAIITNR